MLDHKKYISRCLELAKQADGRTSPNPLVGSVVVDDNGSIIAEGYHQAPGQPHAEVIALDKAGDAARGKTLYVSLEPCCHFGKTPPCSDRVIASQVKQVVFAMMDPNPKVQGGGNKALAAAGIETLSGFLEPEARNLNRGFLKWIEKQCPWVCLKMAATLDGAIADRNGHSRYISGAEARLHVQQLRNIYDCILVGSTTAIKDDPELTVRELKDARNPLRVVVDSKLSISNDSKLCQNKDGLTRICTSEKSINSRSASFAEHVGLIAANQNGDHLDLKWILKYLGNNNVRKILCEGGAQLAGALLEQDLVDELEWIIAPKLMVDGQSTKAVDGKDIRLLPEAINLISPTYKELGNDLLVRGFIHEP